VSLTSPPTERADIDEVDRKILETLIADGRARATDLADAAGVATSTATKRLQRLEEDGVVDGYRPDIDYAALGYEVTAVFRIDARGDRNAVVTDLRDTGRMVSIYEMTGSEDVLAIGKFADAAALNARVAEILDHEHVRTVATDIVVDTVCGHDPPSDLPE
jgi:DNA-binding Lrp family transcriptional regulator